MADAYLPIGRRGMFGDDETRLAEMTADVERIRKLLLECDLLAEQVEPSNATTADRSEQPTVPIA